MKIKLNSHKSTEISEFTVQSEPSSLAIPKHIPLTWRSFFSSSLPSVSYIILEQLGLAKKGIQLLFCDCESERRAAVCKGHWKIPKEGTQQCTSIYASIYEHTHSSGTRGYCWCWEIPVCVARLVPIILRLCLYFPCLIVRPGRNLHTAAGAYQNEKREGSLPFVLWPALSTDGHGSLAGYNCDLSIRRNTAQKRQPLGISFHSKAPDLSVYILFIYLTNKVIFPFFHWQAIQPLQS